MVSVSSVDGRLSDRSAHPLVRLSGQEVDDFSAVWNSHLLFVNILWNNKDF